jgi:hypothetical protein
MPFLQSEVITPAGLRSSKIGNGLALIVVVGPKQDQLTLHHVLGLEPELGRATTIGGCGALGHNTLQTQGTGLLEQHGTIPFVVVIEMESRAGIWPDKLAQLLSAVPQRFPAQIDTL